ncbi:MAG: nicotinate-nucleotide--dimethylbenzimidazole phosphoribosyltransferase [Methylophaga sp.]|uniref:nicotinate-nucleotide--dimethylbenzimidazole phosphoribosyltransferase n=1 Tax=Methylophaga sp. TaxID=2024840 RepID=UPI00299E5555|nr:nicotinate-nucleotide--dimethylbenzimidazole phosphoribosyltransferase [Methylophaga sp.]MDX1750631.1 nicotinate-nucleotide--dimethylbenzimidazole phosphoribosyltransferase [Methylophaga sp.]
MIDFTQWLTLPAKTIDQNAAEAALTRQSQLTKPAGSLGQLEHLAVQLAALQGKTPNADHVHITVYAADHGVMAENISAYPQSVTAAMIRNFASGGAAISVLAKHLDASLDVINVGTVSELEEIKGVQDQRIANGTANFHQQAAMTEAECNQAMLIGQHNVECSLLNGTQIYIAGDMGIGNTTAASAMACAMLNLPASQLAGPGTGLNAEGVSHKATIIKESLLLHKNHLDSPLAILRYLGGFEIAAMVGSYLHCAKSGLPVVIDGFISSVAALSAEQICPGSRQWFLFSHHSAEPGHSTVLQALEAQPLVNFKMRLGEASGAAVAIPLLRMACALHNQMATFEEASIAGAIN